MRESGSHGDCLLTVPTPTGIASGDPASADTYAAVLVDAHVHIHRCFDLAELLNHAAFNFRTAARELALPANTIGCLMLTESSRIDRFQDLLDMGSGDVSGWSFRPTSEECSLIAERAVVEGAGQIARAYPADPRTEPRPPLARSDRLLVVAGRQIATAERLEVLALATRERFSDGMPLAEAIDAVLGCGAVCVLPWGFGKWTGRRGKLIRQIIQSPLAERIFLGDNAGRLAWGPQPSLFRLAESHGIPVLPGTDPFPFSNQVHRPGRYGFVLRRDMTEVAPAQQLRLHLSAFRSQPLVYGQLERTGAFVWNQLSIQLANRWTASP